jgi:hypothetical protein
MLISISRPGLWLSDFEFNFRGQCCKVWLHHQLVSETSQVVCSPFYLCFLITESHFSIVSRMLSNLPSQIQQEIEFIRPIVKERFAKMEEYGEEWDDKPVWQTLHYCIWSLPHHLAESQNDALMWLMSEAKGVERSVEGLARRLLLFNFASIHTTYLASGNIPSPPMQQS